MTEEVKEKEKTAREVWQLMNPTEITPPSETELALAIKLVEDTDIMMVDFQHKLDQLKRN